MPKKYYSLETNGDNAAELYIFGDITSWPWLESDVSANGLVKELQKLDAKEINVHINSYGGEVAEGLAIYNILKNSNMNSSKERSKRNVKNSMLQVSTSRRLRSKQTWSFCRTRNCTRT